MTTLNKIQDVVSRQLMSLALVSPTYSQSILQKSIVEATERMTFTLGHLKGKYFDKVHEHGFDVHNSDQYSMFLYLLANSSWKRTGTDEMAIAVCRLNKALHSIDVWFDVELPSIFRFVHPVGTILGKGRYGDYFAVYQGCTVGGDLSSYPTLGSKCLMYSHSSIIGASLIGSNCTIGSNTNILKATIPSNSLVVGNGSDQRILSNTGNRICDIFKID